MFRNFKIPCFSDDKETTIVFHKYILFCRFNFFEICRRLISNGIRALSNFEDECNTLTRNVEIGLPADAALYPRRKEYAAELPRKLRTRTLHISLFKL